MDVGNLLGFMLLSLSAPAIEEFIFRAWLQTLLQRWRPFFGAIVAGLVFWALHGFAWSVIFVTAYATYMRFRHRSLAPGLALHFFWDVMLGIAAFIYR